MSINDKHTEKQIAQARIKAHAKFDPLWRSGVMTRDEAYAWLSVELQIEPIRCHMKYMDVRDCNRVMRSAAAWMESNGYNDADLRRMELDRLWEQLDL